MNVYEEALVLIADYFLLEVSSVSPGMRLAEDLGADSLELLEIVNALNARFGVELPEREVAKVRTVEQLCGVALMAVSLDQPARR